MVLALTAFGLCLMGGCASNRNKVAGDPLRGDFSLERMKALSSPPQSTAAAQNAKAPPIPNLDLNASNAGLANQDPLRGSLAIDRQTPVSQQDPWQAYQQFGQQPKVQPLPRDVQMPMPQIVPPNPSTRNTNTGAWQGAASPNSNAAPSASDYAALMQQAAANQASQFNDSALQLRDNLSAGANQLQQNTAIGVQQVRENLATTASDVQQNTLNPLAQRMDAIRNAAATEFGKLKTGAQSFGENVTSTAAQLQQNALNAFGQRTDSVKSAVAADYNAINTNVQQIQNTVNAQSTQLIDSLQGELKGLGVRWQEQKNVAEGVRFSCIVPNPSTGSNRIYEATAADYPAALRAVLQQIKGQ